jgi:hypothetical protein
MACAGVPPPTGISSPLKALSQGSSNLRRALSHLTPHCRGVLLILGLALAAATVQVLEPLAIKHIIDHLTLGADLEALAAGVAALS